jgi:hypothetical protein
MKLIAFAVFSAYLLAASRKIASRNLLDYVYDWNKFGFSSTSTTSSTTSSTSSSTYSISLTKGVHGNLCYMGAGCVSGSENMVGRIRVDLGCWWVARTTGEVLRDLEALIYSSNSFYFSCFSR